MPKNGQKLDPFVIPFFISFFKFGNHVRMLFWSSKVKLSYKGHLKVISNSIFAFRRDFTFQKWDSFCFSDY